MARTRLGADEWVVLQLRSHGKTLVRPAAALVLLGGLLGVGTALVPSDYRPAGQYVVVLAVLALAWWWSVLPYLRWLSRSSTITNHRLLTRQGISRRTGHDLPLARILNVSYSRSLSDRMLGCGTLVIRTAPDPRTAVDPRVPAVGALVLEDVPDVELVHRTLTELLFDRPPAARQQRPWPAAVPQPSWGAPAGRR